MDTMKQPTTNLPFEDALKSLKDNNNVVIKRKTVKNETFICWYKNRLYQVFSGIRFPYVPSGKDISSNDWDVLTGEDIKALHEKNDALLKDHQEKHGTYKTEEAGIMEFVDNMCAESLYPELMEKWEEVKAELFLRRQALK